MAKVLAAVAGAAANFHVADQLDFAHTEMGRPTESTRDVGRVEAERNAGSAGATAHEIEEVQPDNLAVEAAEEAWLHRQKSHSRSCTNNLQGAEAVEDMALTSVSLGEEQEVGAGFVLHGSWTAALGNARKKVAMAKVAAGLLLQVEQS